VDEDQDVRKMDGGGRARETVMLGLALFGDYFLRIFLFYRRKKLNAN